MTPVSTKLAIFYTPLFDVILLWTLFNSCLDVLEPDTCERCKSSSLSDSDVENAWDIALTYVIGPGRQWSRADGYIEARYTLPKAFHMTSSKIIGSFPTQRVKPNAQASASRQCPTMGSVKQLDEAF